MLQERISCRLVIAAALAAAFTCDGRQTSAVEVPWDNPGSGGWEVGANWNGPVPDEVPLWQFDEAASIANGGTSIVSTDRSQIVADVPNQGVAGVRIANAGGVGTLRIAPGGNLTSFNGTAEAGTVNVGGFGGGGPGTGNLIMDGTQANPATLTAPALGLSGNVGSMVDLSGHSNLNITNLIMPATPTGSGALNLDRIVRITGPNVVVTATGAVTINNYTAVITAAAHSTIKSPGNLTIATGGGGSNLNLQFSGHTPTVGQTWTLFDVGSIGTTRWDNVPAGGFVPFTGATVPVGSGFRLKTTPGGTHGQQLQIALESNLVLTVNRDTGEMTVRNPLGAAVTQLTGYEILSARGSLLASYKGISGVPAGNPGWEKAPTNNANGLGEFKPAGSFNVSSAATNVALGNGFNRLAFPQANGLGNLGLTGEDLTFRYTSFGGVTLSGTLEYVGTPFLNNLAIIASNDGQVMLKNDSTIALSIDGYTIESSTGALSGAGWNSLADRTDVRFDGWQESPVTANAISETNPALTPVLTIQPGEAFSLGDIGDFSTPAARAGLTMTFILNGAAAERAGGVRFALPGDFDASGRVDGLDFLQWQRNYTTLSFNDWKANFGSSGAVASAAAVPEPSVALFSALGVAFSGAWRRLTTRGAARRGRRSLGTLRFSNNLVRIGIGEMTMSDRHCLSFRVRALPALINPRPQSRVRDFAVRAIMASSVALLALSCATDARAQSFTITYVDASLTNTVQAASFDAGNGTAPVAGNTTPLQSVVNVGNDNIWWFRTGFGLTPAITAPPTGTWNHGAQSTIIESGGNGGPENSPRLATTVSGLLPRQYTVYAYFWDANPSNWNMRASLTDSTNHLQFYGDSGAPAGETSGTIIQVAQDTNSPVPRVLYQAEIGVTAPNTTSISVFIDDLPGTLVTPSPGNNARTWYDGIGYKIFSPPGDANFDGLVNTTDYNLLRDNLAKTVTAGTLGDLNGNGKVTLTDFHIWKAAPKTPALPAGDVVPEPGTGALAGFGVLAAVRYMRRRGLPRRSIVATSYGIAAVAVCATLTATAQAQTITYVDVTPTNTLQATTASGPVGAGVVWAGTSDTAAGAADGQWHYRQGFGLTESTTTPPTGTVTFDPSLSFLMEASGPLGVEDAPRLRTTVSGLSMDTYDVYVYFWVAGADYYLRAGLTDTAGPMPLLTSTSGTQIADTTATTTAQLRQVLIGQVTGTSFTVFAEDRPASVAGNERTWYDGVGYAPGLLLGDVNGDDLVNAIDYGIIRDNFRMTGATRPTGDLTGDTVVNLDDYTVWRNAAPPAVLASLGVPEPSCAALAAAALLMVGNIRRTRLHLTHGR